MTRTPAICGGRPAFPEGPPAWRPAREAAAAALRQSAADGTWSGYDGPNLTQLVERMRAWLACEHVTPCSSGTIAVELALRGVNVRPGDEVLLGAYDFPGNFRAIEAIGAVPVLVDLDASSRCLDLAQVAAAIGPQTKAVIATHLHGGLVDMPKLGELAAERRVAVVEDACQVPGATIDGRPAGTWGDVGTLSFGGSKLLSAGRGGAVFTPRADVHQRIKVFAERGNQAFPLSELQATVLLPQLDELAELHARRLGAAAAIIARLGSVEGLMPIESRLPRSEPAFYKLGIAYDAAALGGYSREQFCAAARAEGIALDPGFRGFTLRSERRCRRIGETPIAKSAAERTMLLHHPVLLEPESTVVRVAEVLSELADLFRRRAVSFDMPSSGEELI